MEAGTIPPPAPIINNHPSTSTGSTKAASISPSVFIIAAIVAIALVSVLFIHRLIRFFFGPSHGSSYHFSFARTISINAGSANNRALSEHEKAKLIDSLPIFTLASSLAKLPKSSLDCAVCYEPFSPDAELRLLPACKHAFHKSCVDKWLKSNPSCPLCRSSITLPYPPLTDLSSGSFRLELGNVSLRRSEPENQVQNQIRPPVPPLRTYSLESHDYFIEEEVEIVQPQVTKPEKRELHDISDIAPSRPPRPPPPPPPLQAPLPRPTPPPPPPPIETVISIESLSREKPIRGWLQEYIDGLASSASSSFNSMRFPSQRWSERWSGRWSQRSSQRFDTVVGEGAPPETWLWDLEAEQNEEAGGLLAVYRWFTGV
ncbi:hypothetical protein LUZ61_018777 [Rhynchospora tenuis]|uniref:RING-type domain-containing protein n=1 Tax=Rhynchospora tenuis TaxID=198213 RepID=A0AAD6EM99_9POAL|nr:hypothetical protein LUZ61_018777 [Rhynchospora tenuis]